MIVQINGWGEGCLSIAWAAGGGDRGGENLSTSCAWYVFMMEDTAGYIVSSRAGMVTLAPPRSYDVIKPVESDPS